MAGLLADPVADLVRDAEVLRDVGAPSGPLAAFIAVGTEWVTNSTWASWRTSSPSSASALSVASTIASTKPGWLK